MNEIQAIPIKLPPYEREAYKLIYDKYGIDYSDGFELPEVCRSLLFTILNKQLCDLNIELTALTLPFHDRFCTIKFKSDEEMNRLIKIYNDNCHLLKEQPELGDAEKMLAMLQLGAEYLESLNNTFDFKNKND